MNRAILNQPIVVFDAGIGSYAIACEQGLRQLRLSQR
jgi:hypothetical protein